MWVIQAQAVPCFSTHFFNVVHLASDGESGSSLMTLQFDKRGAMLYNCVSRSIGIEYDNRRMEPSSNTNGCRRHQFRWQQRMVLSSHVTNKNQNVPYLDVQYSTYRPSWTSNMQAISNSKRHAWRRLWQLGYTGETWVTGYWKWWLALCLPFCRLLTEATYDFVLLACLQASVSIVDTCLFGLDSGWTSSAQVLRSAWFSFASVCVIQ